MGVVLPTQRSTRRGEDEAGYRGKDITINTDQEESVMALKRAIAARREGVTTPIESKVRVSKTHGRVERAVQQWMGATP